MCWPNSLDITLKGWTPCNLKQASFRANLGLCFPPKICNSAFFFTGESRGRDGTRSACKVLRRHEERVGRVGVSPGNYSPRDSADKHGEKGTASRNYTTYCQSSLLVRSTDCPHVEIQYKNLSKVDWTALHWTHSLECPQLTLFKSLKIFSQINVPADIASRFGRNKREQSARLLLRGRPTPFPLFSLPALRQQQRRQQQKAPPLWEFYRSKLPSNFI